MDGFADYQISVDQHWTDYWNKYYEIADESPNYGKDVMDGVKMIMDSIVNNSKDIEEVILDIRFNRGGWDDVALNILGYFTDKEKSVFTKKTRLLDGYSDKQEILLTPSESRLVKQTYLLTSHMTASAAEIMALSALEVENVTIVGSRTKGIFSDILSKTLPNGWKYGLSNEIYESLEGINFENKGIPPDFEIDYNIDPRKYCIELTENEDLAIEMILKQKI
jgi:C-terminal processing protease CtpA/Prc